MRVRAFGLFLSLFTPSPPHTHKVVVIDRLDYCSSLRKYVARPPLHAHAWYPDDAMRTKAYANPPIANLALPCKRTRTDGPAARD